jgi:sporulation-control protein
MFKKMLAKVGIGGAKIDAVLENDLLVPGESIKAKIYIKGGKVEQEISGIELSLMTQVQVEIETDDGEIETSQNFAIDKWHIADKFTIGPDETLEYDFEGELHPETPVTTFQCAKNKSRVWLQTELEIDVAIDAKDRDYIDVAPNAVMQSVVSAMDELGFRLYKTDVEKGYLNTRDFSSTTGCYQELEFKPAKMGLWKFSEVEISFVLSGNTTNILIEIDRVFRGDGYRALTIANDNFDHAAILEELRDTLH